jgi:pyochelin biosynthesis protein PchC
MRSRWQLPQDLWLRPCGTTAQRATTRLVCLPHAGGTAQGYRSWSSSMPDDIRVLAVQYPGRQDRFDEPLVDEVDQMVAPIADAMRSLVGSGQLVIFGHSMGAVLAYELTLELERRHGHVIDLLVVSGAHPPHIPTTRQVHRLGDAELVADVVRLNPGTAELFRDPGLVDLVLPMIRTDYRLAETYHRPHPESVAADVLAVGGASDPNVSATDLDGWAVVGGRHFEVRTFPGDHFYLVEEERALTRSIAARLERSRRATTPLR